MKKSGSGMSKSLRRAPPKRSDWVAEQIKTWIAVEGLSPGDRLPQEKALIDRFGVSKGTIREALKSLEVQGLVRVSTGPKGGATVASVSVDRSTQLLANYFYFQDLAIDQVYAVRRLLEPELAALVADRLTETDFQALEASIGLCSCAPADKQMTYRQRLAELDFHDVLANACPNPLLAFNCRFINALLRDCTVFRKLYADPDDGDIPSDVHRLAEDGLAAHRRLLDAFRRRDAEAARREMHDHILRAEQNMAALEAVIERRFIDEPHRVDLAAPANKPLA
jgi:DNA-binding FadR family transcriptional regulator